MKDHVKILLVGDSQVGKSSLLSSFVSRHFPQEVPPVLADAVIPPETTANNVCVTIMDSSAKQSDRETLRQKISIADSIIALYDVTRTETLDNLSKVWLPMIRDSANGGEVKPVVIVGTKMDLLVEEEDIEKLHYILTNFPFALICWHCSAAKLQDVDQVFYYGEIIVTCPLSPMYDIIATEFTPACRKAFLRIFRIFDRDNDNLLSDQEVCQCQYSCFEVPINNEELMAIKKQISKKIPGGIMHNCVTFEGWLGIIKMNIDKHNFTFPWTILRRFDYEDDLRILVRHNCFDNFVSALFG